ncbi:hypothetical protein CDIK_1880 [Cucumispora dikerogammari]|nr:hypothetical protein CDIK_1880 [Cucumispora dikerogammari]
MFLLNQSFLSPLKRIIYKIDILNRHICPLVCSRQNEQVVEDPLQASIRIAEIKEELKMLEDQSNNIDEYISLSTDQQTENITPVTYITETTQKRHENPIMIIQQIMVTYLY